MYAVRALQHSINSPCGLLSQKENCDARNEINLVIEHGKVIPGL